MSKKPKDNTVGPWAAEKLDSLQRGLNYWTTRLKNQPYWTKVYVDAFAGPGLSQVRTRPKDETADAGVVQDLFQGIEPDSDPAAEEVTYLKGSPRVALELTNPFDQYIFVERDPGRLAELNTMKAEFGNRCSIDVRQGDASEAILALLNAGFNKRTHRGYAFLDPFGLQMPWSTIEAIAHTAAIEVMINFPMGMAIRRMMPKSGEVPRGWEISLDAYFGSSDWRQYAYEETVDLAGTRVQKFADSEERLLDWYRARLRGIFGHVSEAQLVTNTRGGRLYYLIWAGPHEAGLIGANYILTMKAHRGPKRK